MANKVSQLNLKIKLKNLAIEQLKKDLIPKAKRFIQNKWTSLLHDKIKRRQWM